MTRFEERLTSLVKQTPGLMPRIPPDANPPVSARGKPIDAQGVVIAVLRDGKLAVGAGELTNADHAREHLGNEQSRAIGDALNHRGPEHSWPLYVWADRDTPVSAVAELVRVISTQWSLRLLVAADQPSPARDAELLARPSVKRAIDKFPKTEPEAMLAFAEQLKSSLAPCDELLMVLVKATTEAGPSTEGTVLATQVPRTVASCGCKLNDLDVFEYSILAMFGAFHQPLRWIDLPKLAPGDRRKIGDLVGK
jgi:hypothetical protein